MFPNLLVTVGIHRLLQHHKFIRILETTGETKPKQSTRSIRPPSLNLPLIGSPTTPTPVTAKESAASFIPELNGDAELQNVFSNPVKVRDFSYHLGNTI